MVKPLLLAVLLSLFLVFSMSSSSCHARSFLNAGGEIQADGGSAASVSIAESEWMDGLMGMEEEKCESGEREEECLKRRMVSEVHLDYIYTQTQPPR